MFANIKSIKTLEKQRDDLKANLIEQGVSEQSASLLVEAAHEVNLCTREGLLEIYRERRTKDGTRSKTNK